MALDLRDVERLLPGLGVVRIAPVQDGFHCSVYELRTAAGEALILKHWRDEFAWKGAKEAAVYRLLEERRLPVARLVAAGEADFAVTKLDGRPLLDVLAGLTNAELAHVMKNVGALLRRLHEIELDAFGYIVADGLVYESRTNDAYMLSQFERHLPALREHDPALADTVEAFVAERAPSLASCGAAVLCHNDCHAANLLVDEQLAITGLVDFENAVAGDPLLDLAKAHYYSERRSPELLAALLSGYGERRADWAAAFDVYVLYHELELWAWLAEGAITEPLPELLADMRRTVARDPLPDKTY
jgi:hygromycin-B 7''-O-kinase